MGMADGNEKPKELYIPFKCSATNRLITAKDHASAQINVGHVDKNGVYSSEFSTVSFCGFVRKTASSDNALNKFAIAKGLMRDISDENLFPPSHKFQVKTKDNVI